MCRVVFAKCNSIINSLPNKEHNAIFIESVDLKLQKDTNMISGKLESHFETEYKAKHRSLLLMIISPFLTIVSDYSTFKA